MTNPTPNNVFGPAERQAPAPARRCRALRTRAASLLSALTFAAAAAGVIAAPSAAASTVRPGAQNFQIDVMLDGYETEAARRSFWAATVICWDSGVAGKLLALGPCQGMVSVCAAQAYYSGKWAGITFAPGTAWCWKY